ncbi:MAG: peptidase C39 family protein [Acidiferrobacterales bacterium]
MASQPVIRPARSDDLEPLLAIEQTCFENDRLSRRSFTNFIKPGSHELLVIVENGKLAGYVLNLYRIGTNLGRMYSIAVVHEARGRGYGERLLQAAEKAAQAQHCVFMRLEVNVENQAAIHLYEQSGYHNIGRITAYYEDGSDAYRMEKRLRLETGNRDFARPFYQQTTDFTCGPASLMMALKSMQPEYDMTRREELRIWREATTIFMAAGHGGCSPYGLALSAWHRGLEVTIYINQEEAPFLDGVRDEEKKSVIQEVHDDFIAEIETTSIKVQVQNLESAGLDRILQSGHPVIALISTWRLNRNKAPHWVYVTASDEEFVYINDPDIHDDPHLTQTDYIHVPIAKPIFREMARFGQKRLRCLIEITGLRSK